MNNLIPTIVCFQGSAWYCAQHKTIKYIGDALNTAKILSDSDVSEIALINLDPTINDYLLDIPKHVNRPISISGGINNLNCARQLIAEGFDRLGFTYPFHNNPNLPKNVIDQLGESTVAIHIRSNHLEQLPALLKLAINHCSASEYIIHDLNLAGSLNGLDSNYVRFIENLTDKNYAISGGYKGEFIPDVLRVYYSTHYMFPLCKKSQIGGISDHDLKSFLIKAKV